MATNYEIAREQIDRYSRFLDERAESLAVMQAAAMLAVADAIDKLSASPPRPIVVHSPTPDGDPCSPSPSGE